MNHCFFFMLILKKKPFGFYFKKLIYGIAIDLFTRLYQVIPKTACSQKSRNRPVRALKMLA